MQILIKKAVLSEKSMLLAKRGSFTFIVSGNVNKRQIAVAIENKFNVKVVDVKVVNVKDKTKMQRTRKGNFTISGYKKAIVRLKEGQKIALFELESAKEEATVTTAETKETKSLLKGTKVKVEKVAKEAKEEKTSETKKKTVSKKAGKK